MSLTDAGTMQDGGSAPVLTDAAPAPNASVAERVNAELEEMHLRPPADPAEKKARLLEMERRLDAETDRKNAFRPFGGSAAPEFNSVLLRETLSCVWVPGGQHDGEIKRRAAVAAALKAFKPADEIEGMLAAQAVALHFGAMECFRRAMHPEQPSDIASKLRKDGANLARGMTEMLEALDRKRGKGPQVVRVERVVVQDGGQAIVGTVAAGAGIQGRGEG